MNRRTSPTRRMLLPTAVPAGGLVLAGCSATPRSSTSPDSSTGSGTGSGSGAGSTTVSAGTGDLTPDAMMAENADYTTVNPDEWDPSAAQDVALDGAGASSEATGVEIDGSTVTVTTAGVYRLTGSLDGQVVVAAPDDALVVLVLDGAEINSTSGAAIEVRSADDVAIHLVDGSTNRVSATAHYAEDADVDAAVYADTDLTVSGTGSLTVTSDGGHGIKSTDDLVVLGGTITVTAVDDALRGKDALVVEGGRLTLASTEGDGMKSKGDDGDDEVDWTRGYIHVTGGTIDITAGDDGVQAFTDTVIAGGTVTVSAVDDGIKGEVTVSIGASDGTDAPVVTVTASTEGIEAANIGLTGGVVEVTASDDGVNASGNAELQARMAGQEYTDAGGEFQDTGERLEVSGGTITIDAEGDGVDSNGTLTVTGGDLVVHGPTRGGNGSLDANGGITVDGGTVLALGPGSMEQTPGSGDQGWVLISAPLAAGQSAEIIDDAGNVLVEVTSRKTATTVIYSGPDVQVGATYSLTTDGQTLGSAVAGEGGSGTGPGGMGAGMGGRPGGGFGGLGDGTGGGADGERPAPGQLPEGFDRFPEGVDGTRPGPGASVGDRPSTGSTESTYR